MLIGSNVRRIRQARGWSQGELALRSGISQPRVSQFERGLQPRDLGELEDLALALNVETALLCRRDLVVGPGGEVYFRSENAQPAVDAARQDTLAHDAKIPVAAGS